MYSASLSKYLKAKLFVTDIQVFKADGLQMHRISPTLQLSEDTALVTAFEVGVSGSCSYVGWDNHH
jgi:hypothetical protein